MRRWARELALGARIALAGGREGLWRVLLTGVGVGLGVAVLLAAASLPTVVDANRDRSAARVEQRRPLARTSRRCSSASPTRASATMTFTAACWRRRARTRRCRLA